MSQGRLTPANETAANEESIHTGSKAVAEDNSTIFKASVTCAPEVRSRRFDMRWKALTLSFPTHFKSSRTGLWGSSYGRLKLGTCLNRYQVLVATQFRLISRGLISRRQAALSLEAALIRSLDPEINRRLEGSGALDLFM